MREQRDQARRDFVRVLQEAGVDQDEIMNVACAMLGEATARLRRLKEEQELERSEDDD